MDAQQLKEWLTEQLETHPEKSKADLARALNIDPPAVSKILNGTRQIKAIEYVRILEFLGVSANKRGLPVAEAEHARASKEAIAGLYEQEFANPEWDIPKTLPGFGQDKQPERHTTFEVADKFMQPVLRLGDHVLIDVSIEPDNDPHPFLISDGYSEMIRLCSYKKNSHPRILEIGAHSKDFQAQKLGEEEFQILGKVVAKLEWL